MSATKIFKCNCKHAFQDKIYGVGRRVFNKGAGKNTEVWKCTVCGKQITK